VPLSVARAILSDQPATMSSCSMMSRSDMRFFTAVRSIVLAV
jgi:hypothetical protein